MGEIDFLAAWRKRGEKNIFKFFSLMRVTRERFRTQSGDGMEKKLKLWHHTLDVLIEHGNRVGHRSDGWRVDHPLLQ